MFSKYSNLPQDCIPHLRTFLAYHSGGIVTRIALGAQDAPCISKAQSESHDSHVTLYRDNSHGRIIDHNGKCNISDMLQGASLPPLSPTSQGPRARLIIMIDMYSVG